MKHPELRCEWPVPTHEPEPLWEPCGSDEIACEYFVGVRSLVTWPRELVVCSRHANTLVLSCLDLMCGDKDNAADRGWGSKSLEALLQISRSNDVAKDVIDSEMTTRLKAGTTSGEFREALEKLISETADSAIAASWGALR